MEGSCYALARQGVREGCKNRAIKPKVEIVLKKSAKHLRRACPNPS
jgi:hypothetical protein